MAIFTQYNQYFLSAGWNVLNIFQALFATPGSTGKYNQFPNQSIENSSIHIDLKYSNLENFLKYWKLKITNQCACNYLIFLKKGHDLSTLNKIINYKYHLNPNFAPSSIPWYPSLGKFFLINSAVSHHFGCS